MCGKTAQYYSRSRTMGWDGMGWDRWLKPSTRTTQLPRPNTWHSAVPCIQVLKLPENMICPKHPPEYPATHTTHHPKHPSKYFQFLCSKHTHKNPLHPHKHPHQHLPIFYLRPKYPHMHQLQHLKYPMYPHTHRTPSTLINTIPHISQSFSKSHH